MAVIPKNRVALVIGVDEYPSRPLYNCIADARMVRSKLEERGFKSAIIENPTLDELKHAIENLRATSPTPEMLLFYFAGHALEYGGAGFLLPRDYPPTDSALAVKHYAMAVSQIVNAMNAHGTKSIIILDACRVWPINTTDTQGLSEHIHSEGISEKKWNDTVIAYSTSAGDAASDGIAGRNSRYCSEFCKQFVRHDLSIEQLFRIVGQAIITESKAKQRPWYYSSLRSEVYFSDLSNFQLLTAHKLPFEEHSLLYLSVGFGERSVLVAGRESHLWEADLSGFWRANGSGTQKIVAACSFQNGMATIDEEGLLRYIQGSACKEVKTDVDHPHGILSNGSSDLVIYGMDGWSVYRMGRKNWRKITHQTTHWSIHAGVILSSSRAWLGGSLGHIVDVSWKGSITENYIGDIVENINAFSLLPCGTVLCGGDSGLLVELETTGAVVSNDHQRERTVTTASMKRQSLINRLDNDRILRYIFDRDSIDNRISYLLDQYMDHCRVMFVHSAPNLPLIVCGNSEGMVDIIDSRDSQNLQRIDAQSGLGTHIQGVRFLSDTELVTLSNAGVIRFYASKVSNASHTGPFLETSEEDEMLIQQGMAD